MDEEEVQVYKHHLANIWFDSIYSCLSNMVLRFNRSFIRCNPLIKDVCIEMTSIFLLFCDIKLWFNMLKFWKKKFVFWLFILWWKQGNFYSSTVPADLKGGGGALKLLLKTLLNSNLVLFKRGRNKKKSIFNFTFSQ